MKITRAIVVAAVLLLPGFGFADWTRVEVGGVSVCKDSATGVTFKPPYSAKADVTKSCNVVTSFLPWLGTAAAQQLGFFRGQFPDNINVGSGAPPAPGLSSPWSQTDIGSPPVAGDAFDSQNVLTIKGSGDFHKDTSAFHFVYQGKTGDWRIDFPITSLTGAGEYRSCGPAILDSLGVDVKYVYLTPSFATGKADFGGRQTSGAGVYETQTYSASNFSTGILRIEKIGSTFTGYMSTNGGSSYEQVGTSTWTPAGTFYIGIHDDSGEDATLSTCTGLMPTLTSISSSNAGTIGFVAVGSGTVLNSTIREDGGTFAGPCAARSGGTTGAVTVPIQFGGGTATAGTDYTNPPYPQTLSWSNAEGGTKCGSVAVINRSGSQSSRTLNYSLGATTGGATLGTATTHTLTITDVNLVGIKFQPGVYGVYNKSCIPYDGVRYGCTKQELLSAAADVCSLPYLQGMRISGLPSFFMSDTVGVYTGTSPDRGYAITDPVLDALEACGKYLVISSFHTIQVNLPSQQAQYFPKYTYDSSFNSDGTASAGTYGFYLDNQASQPSGWTAKVDRTDWRDLAIAVTTAYCSRYASRPGFYGISMIYWNLSLPFANPLPSGYSEATYNTRYREYLAGARAACPTVNLLALIDFGNPNPAQSSTHLIDMRDNTKASLAHNDTIPGDPTWGQLVYAGSAGSPSIIDFRGVVRDMEEVEVPDMCGSKGTNSPAALYDVWKGNDPSQRGRFPTHIFVYMAADCDSHGTGWQAWKTYLSGLGGATVFDGNTSTLHTPAYVKLNGCESSQACQ